MKGSETQSLINDTEDDSAASSLHMDMEPVPSYESTGTYSNHLGYTFTEDDNREFKTVNGTGRVRTTSLNLEASVTLSWQDVKVSTKAKTSSLLQKIQGKTTTPAKQILHGSKYSKPVLVYFWSISLPPPSLAGVGPRVVVSTAAFHAGVRGSCPGFGGLKETKMFLPHPLIKLSIVGTLRAREVM